MALIYNATFDSQTRILSLLDKAGNVISSCEVPSKELVDDITKPLTFKATQDGSTVTLVKKGKPSGSFQTSRDGGNTWADYTTSTTIRLNTGDKVSFRAKTDRVSAQTFDKYFYFEIAGKIEAWHNVMSLYRTNDFATDKSVVRSAFIRLFNGCKSLTKAPELPATTLAHGCYYYMFSGCTSLTQAPALPATALAEYCYAFMFYGCTLLTQAPALPATALASNCYHNMFCRCSSLTQAPQLPATALTASCYGSMFQNCLSLNEVRIAATTTATDALAGWLFYVSATGDFYCNPNATIFPTDSASGIPTGWSRFVLGAEDTGNTTAMYHNGATETVMIGTSDYGVCYALQGWVGFKTLSKMHALGYTFGAQSSLTMYHGSDPVSAYSCDANIDDGFTETMYDVGDGKGYLDIATQNANGYTLTAPSP